MAIVNSYVKLPEGIWYRLPNLMDTQMSMKVVVIDVKEKRTPGRLWMRMSMINLPARK